MNQCLVTDDFKQALQLVYFTSYNFFITGKAGTGKTTFLNYLIKNCPKKLITVAPTGIAALQAQGVTIHSFFNIPPNMFIPEDQFFANSIDNLNYTTPSTLISKKKVSTSKIEVIKNIELIIIDEVSMLRVDLVDAIDCRLRNIKKNSKPFGGIQMIFIGDLFQLPPVCTNVEWDYLKNFYANLYFFSARSLIERPILLHLEHIFRQTDISFIEILNEIRYQKLSKDSLIKLNQHCDENFSPIDKPGWISLTTHNNMAKAINTECLRAIEATEYSFTAKIEGDFPEKLYPIEFLLLLKVGAQVMFIKNDTQNPRRFYNGKMGVVKTIAKNEIIVKTIDDEIEIIVEPHLWKNITYEYNSRLNEITETILGSFSHYPLKLAWAITVHKSQGLTFKQAFLDIDKIFSFGQLYVALSRLSNLEGLVLKNKIIYREFSINSELFHYYQNKTEPSILKALLVDEKNFFINRLLTTHITFEKLLNEFTKLWSILANSFGQFSLEILANKYDELLNHFESTKYLKTKFISYFNAAELLPIQEIWLVKFRKIYLELSEIYKNLISTIIEIYKKKNHYLDFNLFDELNRVFIFTVDQLIKTEMILDDFPFQFETKPKYELKQKEYCQDFNNYFTQLKNQYKEFSIKNAVSNPYDNREKIVIKPEQNVILNLLQKKQPLDYIRYKLQLSNKLFESHLIELVKLEKINPQQLINTNKQEILKQLLLNHKNLSKKDFVKKFPQFSSLELKLVSILK